jgi:anti-sigma-K factor RskA
MNYNRPELLDRLAAEYVLGTLRGRALGRFERLVRELPAARAAVQAWEQRLATLATSVPPVAPPAQVWDRIEARTQPRAAAAAAAARSEGWLARLFKPAMGFAFGAVMTAGLVLNQPALFVSLDELAQQEQALPQSYVGLLTDAGNQPTLLVSSTRQGTRVSVKFLRPVAVPAGRVIQVWALPKDGAPFPLGVAAPADPPKSSTFEIAASSEKLLSKVPRLAVTFEPAPVTGAAATPTGEFVLSGFCVKLW